MDLTGCISWRARVGGVLCRVNDVWTRLCAGQHCELTRESPLKCSAVSASKWLDVNLLFAGLQHHGAGQNVHVMGRPSEAEQGRGKRGPGGGMGCEHWCIPLRIA